jgi:hypothetical protein
MRNVGRASARLQHRGSNIFHAGLKPGLRLAIAFVMIVLLAGAYATSVHRERQRLQALRAEHQRIETELQRVKAFADEVQPVVVLENGDTRVIVDVKQNQQSNPIYY